MHFLTMVLPWCLCYIRYPLPLRCLSLLCHCELSLFPFLVIARATEWPEAISLFGVPHLRTYCLWVPEIASSPKMRAPRNDKPHPCHCEGHGVARSNLSFSPLFPYRRLLVTRDCRVRAKYALPRNDKPHPRHCEGLAF